MATTKKERIGTTAFGYGLLAPQTLGFLAFAVYPLFEVFRSSLYKVNALSGEQTFIGLQNFVDIWKNSETATILANTGLVVLLSSVLGTAVALALAILLNQRLPGINFFRTAIFVPALVTMVAWTVVWNLILQPTGLLNALTGVFGVPQVQWLRGHWLTLVVIVFVQMFKNIGLYMLMFIAALQAVPAEQIDASKVDGAGAWGSFRYVVIPSISPSILMVFMLLLVGSFKIFDIVYLLTQGGPGVSTTVLSYAVYSNFANNDIGLSSAFGVILFLAVLVLTVIVWQARRRVVTFED